MLQVQLQTQLPLCYVAIGVYTSGKTLVRPMHTMAESPGMTGALMTAAPDPVHLIMLVRSCPDITIMPVDM